MSDAQDTQMTIFFTMLAMACRQCNGGDLPVAARREAGNCWLHPYPSNDWRITPAGIRFDICNPQPSLDYRPPRGAGRARPLGPATVGAPAFALMRTLL